MTSTKRFLLLSFGTLFLSSALTHAGSISFASVQPNLILISLIVSALFTSNALFISLLIGLATIFSRQTPAVFDSLAIGTAVAGFTAFFIKQRAVWPDRVGVFILVAYATLVVYLVVSPTFIATHFGLFSLESLINALIGILYFELFAFFVGRAEQ